MKTVSCVLAIVVWIGRVGLSQEASVSWDGTSADITGQAANVNSSPGTWDAADAVWSTTDEVVPVVGSQASFKAAIAQAGSAQRRIAQLNAGGDTLFVGGGSTNAEGVAGYAPSPWANLIGFDTTSFDDYFALSSISVTVRNRIAADTLDIRWFVEAGGKTYVSGVVATVTGATTVALADVRSIEWFAFEKTANIEIGAALGSSVGSPVFTDVDYVGIHQQLTYTALGNWHGAWVDNFSATARFYGPPVNASNEDPADGRTEVLRDVVLGWTSGAFAATHDVYFGAVFDDVNAATTASAVYKGRQNGTTFAPGRLAFDTTYYWRIDEVNAPLDSTIYKGKVWSFTTEPVAYLITDVQASASSSTGAETEAANLVNGSGLTLTADGQWVHGTDEKTMWQSALSALPATVIFEFDRTYKLHEMKVWNHNTSNESLFGLGAKEVTIEVADSNEGPWTLLADAILNKAPGLPGATATDTIPMLGVPAGNVRLTIRSSHGGVATAGLAEVQFFYIPVVARELQPEDGTALAGAEVTLAWRGGREAVRHQVYLDVNDNRTAVEWSDPAALIATVTADGPYGSHTASGLNLGQTYVWKVVEINEAETPSAWDSDVRTFTTPDYLVVDDFERYTNDSPNRVFQAWIDGLGFSPDEFFPQGNAGNGTGSAVGYDPMLGEIMETVVVHGGRQSMPMAYDNTGVATSEAQYTFPAWDWTASGIRSLSLFFCGAAGNTGQLYLKINGTKIPYDGDATDLGMSVWQPWNVDLVSTGVNLKAVTKLAIGIEGSGAKGIIRIDDIRLYPMPPEKLAPTQPMGQSAAYYPYEGDYRDTSGNARDGTAAGAPTFAAGKVGQALSLDGARDYVTIDNWQGILGGNPFTISLWVNSTATDDRTMVCWGTNAGGQRAEFRLFQGRLRVEHGNGNLQGNSLVADGQWHHAALVVTQNAPIQQPQVTLYLDGVNDSQQTTDPDVFDVVASVPVTIGQRSTNSDRYFLGMLDEVQIFERALNAEEVAWLAGRRTPMHKPFE